MATHCKQIRHLPQITGVAAELSAAVMQSQDCGWLAVDKQHQASEAFKMLDWGRTQGSPRMLHIYRPCRDTIVILGEDTRGRLCSGKIFLLLVVQWNVPLTGLRLGIQSMRQRQRPRCLLIAGAICSLCFEACFPPSHKRSVKWLQKVELMFALNPKWREQNHFLSCSGNNFLSFVVIAVKKKG